MAEALGDAERRDQPTNTYVPTKPPERVPVKSEAVYVLTKGEAAARLGITTGEVERMIRAGKLTGLKAGWTEVVPSSQVEALIRPQ